MEINLEMLTTKGLELLMTYGPKLILAIVVLIIGLRVIKVIQKAAKKAAQKSELDLALQGFLANLLGWLLKVILFIVVAGMVGVETTSFIAILGAAGLAIGLALQGTLANFAGGVLLLIFKPYVIGDFIESQGQTGAVKSIQIFSTILLTPDNKTVILPNGAVMNSDITNYTTEGKRRVDITIGVSYSADLKKSKEVIMGVLTKDDRIMKDPAPQVAISELGDSAVNIVVRPWTTTDEYWDVRFDVIENCKVALDDAGISIPFPQRDVHLFNHNS